MEHTLLLILLVLCITNAHSIHYPSPYNQMSALLNFRKTLTIDRDASPGCDKSYPKTRSWKTETNNSDCCSWDGVTCDKMTGHVIEIDLSCSRLRGTISNSSNGLFGLKSLQRLNLAYNDFDGSEIPSAFGNFPNLNHLNLSSSDFSGSVPIEIARLSMLVSLDLSDNSLTLEQKEFDMLLKNLTRLEELVLSDVSISSTIPDSVTKLSSLVNIDLCNTGLQGDIPSSIFFLKKLQRLCLGGGFDDGLTGTFPSGNWTLSSSLRSLELSSPGLNGELHDSIGNLKYLTYLHLEYLNFTGKIPDSIGKLKNLTYLSLRYLNLTGEIPDSIGKLQDLSYLDLSNTKLNGKLPLSIGNLKKLMKLDLSYCNFSGGIPVSLGNLTEITYLGLFHNSFNGQVPITLSNLKQITILDLSNNQLEGNIPSGFATLMKLKRLVLSKNALYGTLPPKLFILSSLQYLDLSSNQINGQIPDFRHQSPLEYISLSNNKLEGSIPSLLFSLPLLHYLDLSSNNLTGQIQKISHKSALEYISLSKNKLQGPIPNSIINLVNLTYLGLSSNNFQGVYKLSALSALSNLQSLDLSHSGLSIITDGLTNNSFPNLQYLYLGFCNISEFPNFVKDYTGLYLSLESNNIHGHVPKWVDEVSFAYLDISRNSFEGPLPILPSTTVYFLASHNNFTGGISPSICNFSSLQMLDLSYNDLSGTIPNCLGNFSQDLSVLNLRKNNFHGTIPTSFVKNNKLRTLNLNGNFFEGPIPVSLANCKDMELLDLGNNILTGKFPSWAESLPKLRVLILHSNQFQGPIETSTQDSFASLRIFDLSDNEFNGVLGEKYFQSFSAMKHVNEDQAKAKYIGSKDGYYQDSIAVVWKGQEVEIDHIITTLTTIDLSGNKFQGEIPEAIHELISLRLLNLSHNMLTGPIPISFGNLVHLETLDLSSNILTGTIPATLVNINSLGDFNVSTNHLEGPIPGGQQFNTFENTSYIDNPGLCGYPLSKLCNDNEEKPPEEEHDSFFSDVFTWKILIIGYICGVPFGMVMGFLMLLFRKPNWLAKILEEERPRKVKVLSQLRQLTTEETTESSSIPTWETNTSRNLDSHTETGGPSS